MKVCVAFCFFFSARSGGTNTFYLITPRSQELCERIGLPMKAGLHCWWMDVAEWVMWTGMDDVGER
jgi:hypothetical protein